jgi:hypothetical protein
VGAREPHLLVSVDRALDIHPHVSRHEEVGAATRGEARRSERVVVADEEEENVHILLNSSELHIHCLIIAVAVARRVVAGVGDAKNCRFIGVETRLASIVVFRPRNHAQILFECAQTRG